MRISPETYPIAAAATAPAWDYARQAENAAPPRPIENRAAEPGQQALFGLPASDPRVIPFDSLTTQAQRESIRARAAELSRPAPLKTEKVEAPRPRARRSPSADQRRLDFSAAFSTQDQIGAAPPSSIICDALVAPPTLRVQAALVDIAIVAIAGAIVGAGFKFGGIQIPLQKSILPFFAAAMVTIPLFYKLLWTAMGRDSIGMQRAGLQLVDFDGHPPSQARRYQRLFGSLLSLFAAGIGIVWALVDEDGLTWHDHISSTFPAVVTED